MKLLTWNIQWGRGVDGRVHLERVVAHARQFADFDVLCLQEVSDGFAQLPGGDGADQFERLARLLPDYAAVSGVATETFAAGGTRRRFGNMLFSRQPVHQVWQHLLPWPADAGVRSMQRVAIEATLQGPQGLLRVTTTHLEYYSRRQRMAQVDRLRDLHREAVTQARLDRPGSAADGPFEYVARAAPAILTGDFNFEPGSAEHDRLLAPIDAATPSYVDAWTTAHPGQPHAPTVGVHDKDQWPGPPMTFDFIFVSSDLAPLVRDVRVDASSDASDHQPMLLDLA